MFIFIAQHRLFLLHLLLMGGLSTLGQMFVYRMIKQFKQHFVPFVITTRKIFTVGLSIFYYHHETNGWQILGLIMVFGIVTYEFVSELMSEKSDSHSHSHVPLH
jgi:drug/metabolite transporter (DMT)-like permease